MSNALFPIALEGNGTAEVESLPSYLHRLALEHGVYVGEFMRFLEKYHGLNHSELKHQKPGYLLPSVLVRPNQTAKDLIRVLENALSRELGRSFLWFMDGPLGRSSEVVAQNFRWCPECFAEMEANSAVPYFKLIWHLIDIESCPVHGTPIEDRCSSCGRDQNTYKKRYRLSFCQHCGASLSKRCGDVTLSELGTSWSHTGGDIVLLFHELAKIDPFSLPLNGIRASLVRIFDAYWDQDNEKELYRVVPRDQLLSVIHSDHPISLKVARRFAYWLGVPLFLLLSGEAHKCTGVLSANWACELHPDFLEINHKPKKDHRKIYKKVSESVERASPPKTLGQLANEAGVSVGYLRHRYPVLVARACRLRREYEDRKRLRKRYYAQKAALDYFLNERFGDGVHSRKSAYKKLRTDTGLPKWVLKNAIQIAYKAAYAGTP